MVGVVLVSLALFLSAMVMIVSNLLDKVGGRHEDEPIVPAQYDERWCRYCNRLVGVEVFRCDAFTDYECTVCHESVDIQFHLGLGD